MTDEANGPGDPQAEIKNWIEAAEEKMEQASQAVTTNAFNLAISFGILPAGLIMLLILLLVRGSLPAMLIASILVVISLIIFSSLVVFISRQRSLHRIFMEQVLPELDEHCQRLNLSRGEVIQLASDFLSADSLIHKHLLELETAGE